jgi:hypothetical protein
MKTPVPEKTIDAPKAGTPADFAGLYALNVDRTKRGAACLLPFFEPKVL